MAQSRRSGAPGIADVAKLAGVSVTTVSRVLNAPEQVSERRRAGVLAAIDELGYRPNGAARALASGRQRMVGVLTGNTTRYGFSTTIHGIEEAARRRNMLVTITVVESDDPAHIRSAVDLVLGQPLSGVVGLEFDRMVSLALAQLPASMPAVAASLTGTNSSGLPRVYIDDELGARLATLHLLDQGHATVHHLAADYPTPSGSGRTYGYLRALAERGVRVPDVVPTGWDPLEARSAALEFLGDDVTALFCFNDDIAMGAISALRQQGRRVPEDVSVVGFDDMPLSTVWAPALTSVRMDFQRLGRTTFDLLCSQLDGTGRTGAAEAGGAPVLAKELPPSLIVRDSTAPPAALR
ncbi:LacI family DNA-binding transcriptional regulator [Planctomonas psychrotolerans]|uniref:LacI family DNA-binding transcriptional regulator n=1 Tax=Planctomonas psychrotolerans TaxID=2528712 RepID=UPI001D0D3570|nr:LacI family DNA-binding transcriptional regulator [Planctomonas psychrotolerans]